MISDKTAFALASCFVRGEGIEPSSVARMQPKKADGTTRFIGSIQGSMAISLRQSHRRALDVLATGCPPVAQGRET